MDLPTLIKIKASLAKNFHIQPSEIDNMAMWEYEMFINYINDMVKEENDKQESEMKKYNIDDYKKMSDPKNYQNPMGNQMKNFGSFGGFGNMNNMKF